MFDSSPLVRLVLIASLLSSAGVVQAQDAEDTETTSTAINGIYIAPDGNVGVGTNAPTSNLHVKGDLLTEGRLVGQGFGGRYGNSVLLNGFNTLGKPVAFVLGFDEANFGPTPKAIQIYNPEANVYKTFIINHPLTSGKYLVHATLEGPEGAVYYRGSARLEKGKTVINLPDYFEALTKKTRRTIQLTNIDGFDQLAVALSSGERIANGRFTVISNNEESDQLFDWEVKAVRSDKPDLIVEPQKTEISVSGYGPYKVGVPEQIKE